MWPEKEKGSLGLHNLGLVCRKVGMWCVYMMGCENETVSELEMERGEGYGV